MRRQFLIIIIIYLEVQVGASNENEGYLIGSRSRDSYKDRLLKFCIENPFYKRICSMTPVSLPPMYVGKFGNSQYWVVMMTNCSFEFWKQLIL